MCHRNCARVSYWCSYTAAEKVEAAFHTLDLNRSGNIMVEDLRLMMGDEVDQQVLQQIIDAADFAKDGIISLEEFTKALQGQVVGGGASS